MQRTVLSALCVAVLHGLVPLPAGAQSYGGGGMGGGSTPHAGPKLSASAFVVSDLQSDQSGTAARADAHLVNAWGLAAGPATFWWVANNATNSSTLYDGAGNLVPLVVTVPGGPTGVVFNGGSGFTVTSGADSGPALFLFATESGMISGWSMSVPSPGPSTQVFTVADHSTEGAVYKGLAIASTPAGDRLYAADFHNARVDVFDAAGTLVTTPGAFVDRRIPRRFAPFGIQNVGGAIVVTYARQDRNRLVDVPGGGAGFVDMFDTSGMLLGRVASHGPLNAPWGVALAPAGFGDVGGDLLIGNFGNGRINAYQRRSNGRWKLHAALAGTDRKALRIDGLWALSFGNGGPSGPTNVLYFTAGPGNETHGLFGSIQTNG